MGNFTGSYHWKTLSDFVTRMFTAASEVAMVALGNAAVPNCAYPGDICVRTDLDNQWFIMTVRSTPSVVGDWTALTVWEASLIAVNAIAQFPALVTIQTVLDDALSGDTGGAGNPFDIVCDAGHGIGAGVVAPVASNVEAAANVVAGVNITAGGGVGAGVAAPLAGNVEAAADVLAGVNIVATAGGVGAGVAAPAAGNIEAAANIVAGTGIVATTGNIQATAGNIVATVGNVTATTRVVGTTGLQAGVTVGDFVITRVGYEAVALAGNGALAAGATADETLAIVGAPPATATIIGLQPSAAMVAGSVLCAARQDGAGNVVIRYGNITAAPIAVAADAAFGVLWMDTVVI